MGMRRLAVPIAIISVLTLLGGVTAGLIWAGDQAPRAVPPSPETGGSPQEATPEATEDPTPTDEPTPTPIPLRLPGLPEQLQTPGPATQRSTENSDPVQGSSGQGTLYTWEDGDRTLRVVLQTEQAVQEIASNTLQDIAGARGSKDSTVKKPDTHGVDAQPVFRSESGGGLMTLTGGVLLALDPEWDQAKVESFFSRNNISTNRTSELEFLKNVFLVKTEPGFPSLELANALAGQDGVVSSSPNWHREVEAR